ncbi:MAG: TIGR00730 family Rossman fold protein [Ruminococcus sp.]|nr:TIGR00730 family Rossman fold protein [Ruminococcus sp.]
MNICVYCASSETIDKSYIKAGEELGKRLAEEGHTLVFGAGKYGLMGAVARGIRQNGGEAVGIIPKFFDNVDVTFWDCEIIKTDTMRERKHIMEDISDGFIMMPGGVGTLEEYFEIITLKQLGRHKKPIAVYDVNGYYHKLFEFLQYSVDEGFMSKEVASLCFYSSDIDKVFEYLKNPDTHSYNKYNFLEEKDGKD